MIGIFIGIIYFLGIILLDNYMFIKSKKRKVFLIISIIAFFIVAYIDIHFFENDNNKEIIQTIFVVGPLVVFGSLINKEN